MEPSSNEFRLLHEGRLDAASNRLASGGVDVILLDLSLPDSHGLETFTKVQNCAPDVPTVLLTGLNDESLAVKAVREGAQDYLVKGEVDRNLLVRAMRYAIERKRADQEREKLIADLQEALTRIKTLSGLLPICASCKKIRDDKGYWNQIETYIGQHSDANFSHSICPSCVKALYPQIAEKGSPTNNFLRLGNRLNLISISDS